MDRMYSLLTVKSVEDDQRIIRGVATTPRPDRVGDIVEPLGVRFTNPLPLLHQHDSARPVGTVSFDKPTKTGIIFEARLPKIEEPGPLKDRVDTAWGEIKAGLVRAVSIGFRAIEHAFMDDGGIRFLSSEVLELSLVSVPANADARISTIKSIDAPLLAATGKEPKASDRPAPPPGVTGKAIKPVKLLTPEDIAMSGKKTVAEQISAFEATRQAKAARMADLMEDSAEKGETLDAEQTEEYDGLDAEVKSVDAHLTRLRALEQSNIASAKAVNGADTEKAAESRGSVRVQMRHTLPKGTMFTRYVMAMAAAKGNPNHALEIAKKWDGQTPEVSAYIRHIGWGQKAEIGTTHGPDGSPTVGWGSDLVYPTNLVDEFVELLMAKTVVGRIEGFDRIPFNTRVSVQTGGSTVNWVGEGAVKPTGALVFDTITMTFSKIAGIVVLTDELVRFSAPGAEEKVRNDLTKQIAKFIDQQFLDPTVTETTDRPASVTNGVTPVTASGTDADSFYYDLNAALAAYDSSEIGAEGVVMVMPTALARGIAALRNALGQFEFTGVSASGGAIQGNSVIVSNSAPAGTIILIKPDEIFLADDGGVQIDASNQATLDMAGGATPNISLWQRNLVAIRAERYIRWKKRRAEAVAMIDTAAYGPDAGSP